MRSLIQVGAAQCQPAFERRRVVVVGAIDGRAERRGGRVQRRFRRGDPGPSGQVRGDRFALRSLDLLR